MNKFWLAVLIVVCGCATTKVSLPARNLVSQSINQSLIVQPKYYLVWSNESTFILNEVKHKTNLNTNWSHYAWVTNSFTNEAWLKIAVTNEFELFRVANAGIW